MIPQVPTRLASLRWIAMLLEKSPKEMSAFIDEVLPALLKTLSDPADEVVLLNLQVITTPYTHTYPTSRAQASGARVG